MSSQLPLFQPPKTRDSLSNDVWRTCDILRRDNNCGGVMEYVEHLAWLLFLRFLDVGLRWSKLPVTSNVASSP